MPAQRSPESPNGLAASIIAGKPPKNGVRPPSGCLFLLDGKGRKIVKFNSAQPAQFIEANF